MPHVIEKAAGPLIADGDRAVPMLEGFATFGIASWTTELKRMRSEPGFPQAFYVGRRGFFLQSEIVAHLQSLAAQRDGAGGQS